MKSEYNNDIEKIKNLITEMLQIVDALEKSFPGRRFTLDGHLLGSIGEVVASYHYGITLFPPSVPKHDGIIDDRKVQVKITQGKSIDIRETPEFLIVLFFDRMSKEFYEVYNGPGDIAWQCTGKKHTNGEYSMSLSRLAKLRETLEDEQKIPQLNTIEQYFV